ncbi:hypothetical protein JW916_11520 [Candidatus Sumerlaeota bacterium]|nr:hypothetical protein [Candidatus Sumerlaeota bacterium]
MATANRKSYALLGDTPVPKKARGDLLRFRATARVLAGAAAETVEPLTIGIFGEWGTGKTSLMQLVRDELLRDRHWKKEVAPVWFNAWQYEKEEHLILPLLATIDRELQKSAWTQFADGAKKVRNLLRAMVYAVNGTCELGLPGVAKAEVGVSLDKSIQRYEDLEKAECRLATGFYFEAFEQLSQCANDSKLPRVVVFVDDLDRCFPDAAVKLLESVKLALHQPGFSFVIGVNQAIIEAFVKTKWTKDYRIGEHFDNYLDKMVQVKVAVPARASGEKTMGDYVAELVKQSGVDFSSEDATSEDVPRLIAEAVNCNPRSIVRLLNRILVAQRTQEIEIEESGEENGEEESAEKEKYDPLALLIHYATDEPRFRDLVSVLDIPVTLGQGEEDKRPIPNSTEETPR